MAETTATISILSDFTRHPGGRNLDDGPFSGEQFRIKLLEPAYNANDRVVVELDGVRGYGSSFLEEAFGGLVRVVKNPSEVLRKITLVTEDPSLEAEIRYYIEHGTDNG